MGDAVATKRQVLALIKQGLNASEIAAALNCVSGYVRATAKRNGVAIVKCKMGPKPLSADEWASRVVKNADIEHRAALVKALI